MGVNLGSLVRHEKKNDMEQWPDIGDGRLESGLGLSGSISIPDQAMTVKWPISFLWICVGKCEYKDTVLVERTEQSQMPLDKCLIVCKSCKRVISQRRTVDIVAHALDSPGEPWRPWSLFPFSPFPLKTKKKKKNRWEVPEAPRNWRDMDPFYGSHIVVMSTSCLFFYFSVFLWFFFSLFDLGLALRYSLSPFFNVRSLHLTYTIWMFRNS